MRILITSDFLATHERSQAWNRTWVSLLLARPMSMASGVVVEAFDPLRRSPAFERGVFFPLAGLRIDPDLPHVDFDFRDISDSALEYLASHLDSNTLVVGYELSAPTRGILTRLGVTYIDMWLHPVRFMDDVLFAFSSNNPEIHAALASFGLDEYAFFQAADLIRAHVGRRTWLHPLRIAENSALFVGQQMSDKSVMHQGRMLNLLDFKDRFEDFRKTYRCVYYSRHPRFMRGDREVLRYVRSRPFARAVRYPTYYMLSDQRIEKVASISSSVVHEAKYFGKQAEWWFRPPIPIGGNYPEYVGVFLEWVGPHFWSAVLRPLMDTKPCARTVYLEPRNKVRDMMDSYWGYAHIDRSEAFRIGSLRSKLAQVRHKLWLDRIGFAVERGVRMLMGK